MRTLLHHTELLVKDGRRIKTVKEKVRVALRNFSYHECAVKDGGTAKKETEEESRRSGNDK